MTEKKNTRVLGVYEDVDWKDSHAIADDTFEAIRYEELLRQGYDPLGTITKDTTEEEFQEIVDAVADKVVPPEDDPVWDALAKSVYQHMEPKIRAQFFVDDDEEEFERKLAEHVANGGDETEYCLSIIEAGVNEMDTRGNGSWSLWEWEREAKGR